MKDIKSLGNTYNEHFDCQIDGVVQGQSLFLHVFFTLFALFLFISGVFCWPLFQAFAVTNPADTGIRPQKSDRSSSISGELESNAFKTLRSNEGFLFSKLDTSWFTAPTPEDKKDIHLLFRSPNTNKGFQPIMTVRVDKNVGNTRNIKNYVEQWMGDYARLGYQVLGSRSFRHKKEVSYVIDVRNQKSKKQIRQAVFFRRKQKAVILTCIDNTSTFRTSLKECNKIIRSFAWMPQTPLPNQTPPKSSEQPTDQAKTRNIRL